MIKNLYNQKWIPSKKMPIQQIENSQIPPSSGHKERSMGKEVCIEENLSSVAKRTITIEEKTISTQSKENITTASSIGNEVLSNFIISEKASNQSWYKVSSANMDTTYQEETIKSESLLVPGNIQPHRPEETSQKPSRKRIVPKKKKKRSTKPSIKEDNFYFRDMVSIMICLLKTVNSIFTQRLLWILFILMATKGLLSEAASITNSEVQIQSEGQQLDLLSFLDKGEENSTFVTYQTARFEIQTYEIDLEEVREGLFYSLESNCATIPMWKTVCDDDTSSCQLADINITTSENAIVILSQSFSIKDGQLQKRYTNASSYTLLSEDSIISQSTKLFGQKTQVIGRSCIVSKSINGSSTPSGNFLFENYHFTFEGQIEITENCPHNGSMVSENWTFTSIADII